MELVTTLTTLLGLVPMDVPNPGNGTAPPGAQKFLTIMGWAKWVCLGICVVALMGVGAVMAMNMRGHGGGGDHVSRLGWALGGAVVVSGAFSVVGFLV